jgi:Cu/Ag efflux protein CusF
MKVAVITVLLAATCVCGCGGTKEAESINRPPMPTATVRAPKDGDYPGRGKVTKINTELGSIELEHDEIQGVMPAMTMEFYVTDKALLIGVKAGETVDFTLRVKGPTETISAIRKLP